MSPWSRFSTAIKNSFLLKVHHSAIVISFSYATFPILLLFFSRKRSAWRVWNREAHARRVLTVTIFDLCLFQIDSPLIKSSANGPIVNRTLCRPGQRKEQEYDHSADRLSGSRAGLSHKLYLLSRSIPVINQQPRPNGLVA